MKIGFIYNDSGPFAQSGLDMRDGFLLYWSEAGQKAAGRAVELVLENKGSPHASITGSRAAKPTVKRRRPGGGKQRARLPREGVAPGPRHAR